MNGNSARPDKSPSDCRGFWQSVTADCYAFSNNTGLVRSLLLNPPTQLLFQYRLAQFLRAYGAIGRYISRLLKIRLLKVFGCDISLQSTIEPGTIFPHPVGIVIGENVFISTGCRIFQNVTIGRRNFRYPTAPRLEVGVVVYPGSVIVGDCTVGENAVVGANCFIDHDLPAGSKLCAPRALIMPKGQANA